MVANGAGHVRRAAVHEANSDTYVALLRTLRKAIAIWRATTQCRASCLLFVTRSSTVHTQIKWTPLGGARGNVPKGGGTCKQVVAGCARIAVCV